MRITATVTSVSWIPSEAIPDTTGLPVVLGIPRHDDPPPAELGDLATWWDTGCFRFANQHTAWIEVDDEDRVTAAEYAGRGWAGGTSLRLGRRTIPVPPVVYEELRAEPEHGDGRVRFVQTAGGRTGAPVPRRTDRAPFVQVTSPTVWTTLALTIHTDGRVGHELVAASPFPRHWVYDGEGRLIAKTGPADDRSGTGEGVDGHTPWDSHDRRTGITDAGAALGRTLATAILRDGVEPGIRRLSAGRTLTGPGQPGGGLHVLLEGMLAVEVNGEPVAEVGPGAIVGEHAVLEGGRSGATLRALTACRVAEARGDDLDPGVLGGIAPEQGPEEAPVPVP